MSYAVRTRLILKTHEAMPGETVTGDDLEGLDIVHLIRAGVLEPQEE